jgi:hypothetical protein
VDGGDFLSKIPTPAWVALVVLALLLAGSVADAVTKLISALRIFVKSLRGLPFVHREIGVQKRRAVARRDFAREVVRGLHDLEVKERWSDRQFAELEARVETEHGSGRTSSALRFFAIGRRLRLRRSLTRSLRTSTEPLLLLQGDPGSGKSVALRHLAIRVGERAARSRRVNSLVPLYINLKGLRRELDGDGDQEVGPDLIEAYVNRRLREGATVTVDQFLDREFEPSVRDGTFLFLFDSFDEIPEILGSSEFDESVASYSRAIAGFLRGMRKCRGVVASRSFRAPEGVQWPTWRIVPLDRRRRRRLVRNALLDRQTEGMVLEGLQRADADLARLSANPMFLNLLCTFVDRSHEFPGGSHEVIEAYIEQRLATDEARLEARFSIDAADMRVVAESAAYCMSAESGLGLEPTRDELVAAITARDLCGEELAFAGLRALEWVKLAQGEDVGPGTQSRTFTFAHRRFQEYFATCAVLAGRGTVSESKLLTDWRWRETAVALLQLQRDEASAILEQAETLLRAAAGEDGLDALQLASIAEGKFTIPTEASVSWPENVRHVLDILQSGTGSMHLSAPLRQAATVIVVRAFANGDTADQKGALDVAGIVQQEALAGMLRASFSAPSAWLRETAYRQVARLGDIPSDVQAAIRRMLVSMTSGGTVWRDRLTIRAQLARLSGDSMRAFRLALAIPVVDVMGHILAVTVTISRVKDASLALCFVLAVVVAASMFTSSNTIATAAWDGAADALGYAVFFRVVLAMFVAGTLFHGADSAVIVGDACAVGYLLVWAPCACLAVIRGRCMRPLFWPVLPAYALVAASERLRRLPRTRLMRGAVTGAALIAFVVVVFPRIGRLPNIVGLAFAGVSIVVGVPAIAVRWWKTTIRDFRWYRAWRKEVPEVISAVDILGWLEEQRTSRGGVRILLDIRLEQRIGVSKLNLDVLSDLGLAIKYTLRPAPHDVSWCTDAFAGWFARAPARNTVSRLALAIDDEVGQLREALGVEVTRRDAVSEPAAYLQTRLL